MIQFNVGNFTKSFHHFIKFSLSQKNACILIGVHEGTCQCLHGKALVQEATICSRENCHILYAVFEAEERERNRGHQAKSIFNTFASTGPEHCEYNSQCE